MSKYNNIKSIPIDSIPKEELGRAFQEFSEGDESMEKLLWACYEKGIETNGCHAGKGPFIGFCYNPERKNQLSPLINAVLNIEGSQILGKADGGNPFSGPDWYKPYLLVGFDTVNKDESDQLLDQITRAVKEESEEENEILELLDFLIDKYSGLSIRINHHNGVYTLSIEKSISDNFQKQFEDYNQLFSRAGFTYRETQTSIKCWEIDEKDKSVFFERVSKSVDYIKKNYFIKKPENIDEAESFIIKAHIKRDECIKNNREKDFEIWLMEEEEKLDKIMKEEYQKRKG